MGMAVEEWGHRATHLWGEHCIATMFVVLMPQAMGAMGIFRRSSADGESHPTTFLRTPFVGVKFGEPHRFILLHAGMEGICAAKRIGYVLVMRLEICLYGSMHHMGYTIASRGFSTQQSHFHILCSFLVVLTRPFPHYPPSVKGSKNFPSIENVGGPNQCAASAIRRRHSCWENLPPMSEVWLET